MNPAKGSRFGKYWIILVAIGLGFACTRSGSPAQFSDTSIFSNTEFIPQLSDTLAQPASGQPSPFLPLIEPSATATSMYSTPTLDSTRPFTEPTLGSGTYVVQPGDTIGSIAERFGVTEESIIALNGITNPYALQVGQTLLIPVPESETPGPNFKIIPDSELIYGPAANGFDPAEILNGKNSYLESYREVVAGRERTGPEIVQYVAEHYSVNPRLLMAALEYCAGWIGNSQPPEWKTIFPFHAETGRENLYYQLAWAADQLNQGYYDWKASRYDYWSLADGSLVRIGPGINAGTAGVQYLMARIYGQGDWQAAVGEGGVFSTFQSMFGYPFLWTHEPVVPEGLVQPMLMLPFEKGVAWYFTGGPHGGWASGSAWAALDFAPSDIDHGCVQSEAWVVASIAGLIVRSDEGAVVLDLDYDGNEHTGWTILYMHLETRDRIPVGRKVILADRLGHPSCEGGYSNGTHVHIARRFNGEWIAADGPIPFVLSGWVASGATREYDGYLTKGDEIIEACDCGGEENDLWV
jgi:LasA protease